MAQILLVLDGCPTNCVVREKGTSLGELVLKALSCLSSIGINKAFIIT